MTRAQVLTIAILVAMIAGFLWERWRYDLVALMALIAALAAGIVPADRAFAGFANPVLPLIAAALVVSAAIGQSGAIEIIVRRLNPLMRSRDLQVGVLAGCVLLLSAFVKNIGALAIFIPAAVQVARRHSRSPSEFLMPLSFAALLGGSTTLVGTSPNILISSVRQQLSGHPFDMFDFTPVAAGVALFGAVFLAFGWRLIPRGLRGSAGVEAFKIEDYTSELRIAAGSPFIGQTVGRVEATSGGECAITAIIRAGIGRQVPSARWKLYEGDVLVVEADSQALERLARDGKLELLGSEEAPAAGDADAAGGERRSDWLAVVEAVVGAGSPMIGRSAAELRLRARFGLNVLAISRQGRRNRARLRRSRLRLGDAIVFQGEADSIHESLAALGCLPLAERQLRLGRPRQLVVPLLILAAAMVVTGLELVPVAIAFVAAALALVVFGLLPVDEAYRAIDWPILILLGALIPIVEAVQTTGTAELIAHALAGLAAHVPAFAVLGALLAVTMLVTPILHHAAAVLVMGPIAASLAQLLGYRIDPFLIAVALGAGSDFLSPIGHQCNTLVMGPGGYRFGDYWKLGLPLSLLVVVLGVPLIMLVWPLH